MTLSNYELMRLERIKKNAERLKELGLDEFQFKPKPKKRKRVSKAKLIKPGEERRSRRLSSSKNDDDLIMLDYRAREGEERVSKQNGDDTPLSRIGTIISKKFPETGKFYEGEVIDYDAENKWYKIRYLDGDEEEFDEEELKQNRKKVQRYAHEKFKRNTLQTRQRTRRTANINLEEWKLSEEDRESLARGADENFLAKFQEFLEYEDRISHQNKRNVMRQVRKLATGEGIRYEVCGRMATRNRMSPIGLQGSLFHSISHTNLFYILDHFFDCRFTKHFNNFSHLLMVGQRTAISKRVKRSHQCPIF